MKWHITRLSSEERKQLKESQQEIFLMVLKELSEIDAVGIAFIPDEYDLEACDVLINLPSCQSVEEVRLMVYEVFASWFTPDLAQPILEAQVSHFETLLSLRDKVKSSED